MICYLLISFLLFEAILERKNITILSSKNKLYLLEVKASQLACSYVF